VITGDAIAALVAGLILAAWAALRLRSGKSYISNPPMAVTRREDPFSYWLSMIPLLAAAAALLACGLLRIFLR